MPTNSEYLSIQLRVYSLQLTVSKKLKSENQWVRKSEEGNRVRETTRVNQIEVSLL